MKKPTLLITLLITAYLPLNAKSWEFVWGEGKPLPRHEAGFVEFEGEFYLMGGRRIQPVSIYNPDTNQWRQASKPPIEFHHFQPVVIGDSIYIIAAMTGGFPREVGIDRVLVYKPKSDTWEFTHPVPKDRIRGAAGALAIDGKIYVACGIINGHIDGHVKWFDRYDPETGEWEILPDAPRERDHFQIAYLDGKIYAAGGRRTSHATRQTFELTTPEVDVYDTETGEWSTLPEPLPTPRAGNSTFAYKQDIIVAGGESRQRLAHKEVEAWDTLNERWKNYPSNIHGRHGTGLLLHENCIYTCSGSGHRGGRPELVSLEKLDMTTAVERDGFVQFEAEDFHTQSVTDMRKWYITREGNDYSHLMRDDDENHAASASGGAYIENLPDTRKNHDEDLIQGENFFPQPGEQAILGYFVEFTTPGRYWVWASAFSTGPEDNGLHIGINGEWPESGQRLQWCVGKHQWSWSSAQRVEHRHCGYPTTIYIDVPTAGVHEIQVSMREDGTEIDQFILVNDRDFRPEGFPGFDFDAEFDEHIQNNGNIQLGFENFTVDGSIPYYRDRWRSAYAINAANKDYRNDFAAATTPFPGSDGAYKLRLKTLTELDGESEYRISVNGKVVARYTNPETDLDYDPSGVTTDTLQLKKGDTITVQSKAHTNGKIPENDETAWARGRWQNLTAIKEGNQAGH